MKEFISKVFLFAFVLFILLMVSPQYSYAINPSQFRSVNTPTAGLGKRTAIVGGNAVITGATLTAKNSPELTVSKDGITYKILTDSSTKLRRRFWGNTSIDEMQINDVLNIHGKWADAEKTTIKARMVRDISIQKRTGAFVGTVESFTSTGLVLNTVARGTQTVTFSSGTKYVNRKEETINQADIITGHRIRIKGLWDKTNNTITDVKHVKDYSLPVKTSTLIPKEK